MLLLDSIIPNGLNEYIIKVVSQIVVKKNLYIQIEDTYMGNIIGSYSSNQITLQWRDPYTTQNAILPKGYLFIRNNNQEALLDYTLVGGKQVMDSYYSKYFINNYFRNRSIDYLFKYV